MFQNGFEDGLAIGSVIFIDFQFQDVGQGLSSFPGTFERLKDPMTCRRT